MNRQVNTFGRIKDVGIIPAIRASQVDVGLKTADAILAGGISIIEVSLAPKNALDVLGAIAATHGQSMLVGAGTVVNAEGVRQAARAGACFIVTPGFDLAAVNQAREFGLPILAGAMTPTEVQVASASGAEAVKLFPCFAMGGSRYLRSLLGQYPTTEFIASGGVGLDNCEDYIRAGACGIGVGGEIVDACSMAAGSYSVFTVRAARLREAVTRARGLFCPRV